MTVVPNQAHFKRYPVNHVLGIVADEHAVDRLCAALEGLGLASAAIKVFYGPEGRQNFDHGEAGVHGLWERASSVLTGTRQDKLAYVEALEQGEYVVALDLHGHLGLRDAVGQVFRTAGARDVNLLGELVVDSLD